MTASYRHFVFAFGVILVGLAGRSAIDKLLALSGGAGQVAQWAQVQSLLDMVLGAISIGIGQGVTVLVAQQGGPAAFGAVATNPAPTDSAASDSATQRGILRSGLVLGGALGLLVGAGLCLLLLSGVAGTAWPHGPGLAALAATAGASGIAAALINAYWLGRHQQNRVFWLSTALMLPPVLAAGFGASIASIVWAQLLAGLLVSLLIARWLSRGAESTPVAAIKWRWPKIFVTEGNPCGTSDWPGRPLWRYVPVGLSIGLASPLSQVLVRGEVSAALSWHEAGVIQAIWRAAEWVTLIMAGALSLVYLPRFSNAVSMPGGLARQMRQAAWRVLGATSVLLLLLWLNQRRVLSLLYESHVIVSDFAMGLFLLGEWLRVASWVILFGLLARRATWWVTIGEFLSLPLFAGLVIVFADGISLERAGGLYLATYVVYLAFNVIGIRAALRRG